MPASSTPIRPRPPRESERTKLQIAPDFGFPLEAVTETIAILAKRGSGKTYCAAVLVEEMVKAGLPVVVVDPIGVWWGLRSNAKGDGPGLPVVIFGGDRADLPLDEGHGALIADLIIEERLPAVLDLSLLSKGASRRFMTAFAERLFHRNREPLHLVLDEADAWAPQRAADGGQRLLGAIEDLVRRGRARGLGLTLITQRPAVLHKDVLTQCEVLIALRMTGPRDVAAIDEWVRLHADEDEAGKLKASLPALPIGTAWVWSPGWLGVLQQIKVRKRQTFDSSATPKVGEKRVEPSARAAVDLEALRARLQSDGETEATGDVQAMVRQIADLKVQLKARPLAVERIEVPVEVIVEKLILAEGEVEKLEEKAHDMIALAKDLGNLGGEILRKLNELDAPKISAPLPMPKAAPVKNVVSSKPKPASQAAAPDVAISQPQQRILDALATFAALGLDDVARSNVAVWAKQSPKSGGFTNNLGALRSSGLVDYPSSGRVALTALGSSHAHGVESLSTLAQLHDAWCSYLSAPQERIVRALLAIYPDALTRADLAEVAEQSANSGGYSNNLGALRTLGLVDYPRSGHVAATGLLFPAGLK